MDANFNYNFGRMLRIDLSPLDHTPYLEKLVLCMQLKVNVEAALAVQWSEKKTRLFFKR
jgi:hypothetical protein